MNTDPIHLAQVSVNVTNAVRHLRQFLGRTALDDDTLVLKTALTEGFGGAMIRPWTVHDQRGATAILVGYSRLPGDDLNRRRALSMPSLQKAVGEVATAAMPELKAEDRFRFAVKLVPTIRVTPTGTRKHGERDAFLVAVEGSSEDAGLRRDDVYADYLRERLKGVTIESCRLGQFRLRKFARPRRDAGHAAKTMPEVIIEGTLMVENAELFKQVLQSGVGRQRAYGYGMVRLQP